MHKLIIFSISISTVFFVSHEMMLIRDFILRKSRLIICYPVIFKFFFVRGFMMRSLILDWTDNHFRDTFNTPFLNFFLLVKRFNKILLFDNKVVYLFDLLILLWQLIFQFWYLVSIFWFFLWIFFFCYLNLWL